MRLSISKLRGFIPSRSYKWDIKFQSLPNSKVPNPPDPFSDWFPAVSCEVDEQNFSEGDFSVGGFSFSYPSNISLGSVSLSFIPDEEEKIVDWLKYQEDLRKQGYLLSDLIVGLYIVKYSGDNQIVRSYNLIVFLSSNIKRSWNSDNSVEVIPVEFKIAGFLQKK